MDLLNRVGLPPRSTTSANPEAKTEAGNERRPRLEVRSQEVDDPAEERTDIRRSLHACCVFGVKQVFEPGRSAAPVHAHQGQRTQILSKGQWIDEIETGRMDEKTADNCGR